MTEHVYEKHTPESLSRWQFYLSLPEIQLLTDLTISLPDSPLVLNLGAGAGTSALTFITARPDVRLVTVDIQEEISLYGGLANERGILKAAGMLDAVRYSQIHADSKDAGRDWRGGQVNLVFVDGDHTREGCEGDLRAWWPHLVTGGVMVFHDYMKQATYERRNPGVEITQHLLETDVKPYPDVDAVADELLAGVFAGMYAEHVATADTAIAVRKVRA